MGRSTEDEAIASSACGRLKVQGTALGKRRAGLAQQLWRARGAAEMGTAKMQNVLCQPLDGRRGRGTPSPQAAGRPARHYGWLTQVSPEQVTGRAT